MYPRFEQARSLRQASVARKIGALRESVVAALETLLDREKRGKAAASPLDTREIEVRLRCINGEIGEQRSILFQAFLELGEQPDVIVAELAETIAARIASGGTKHFTPFEISEWTHDAVQSRVDRAIAQTRESLMRAVGTLTDIAREMARSDVPSTEDAEWMLREVPRFEIEVIPVNIAAARWRWMGRSTVRALVKNTLREHLGPLLKEELHRYKRALELWTEQTSRTMVAFVNSFADAYRAQLNRVRGLTVEDEASPELATDLARLLQWDSEKHADARQS